MRIPPQVADRLALLGGLASAAVTLTGAVTLMSGDYRVVDLLTTGASAVGAAGSLTAALARMLPSRATPPDRAD